MEQVRRQIIDMTEAGIFEELASFIASKQQQQQTLDFETLERILYEQRGAFLVEKRTPFRKVWTTAFRLPSWELRHMRPRFFTFKRVVQQQQQMEEPCVTLKLYQYGDEMVGSVEQRRPFKITLRLPRFFHEQQWREAAVHITREGIVFVKVPAFFGDEMLPPTAATTTTARTFEQGCCLVSNKKGFNFNNYQQVKSYTVIKQKMTRTRVTECASIFEELEQELRNELQVAAVQRDVELLERLLQQRGGQHFYDTNEWIQVQRMTQYLPQEVSFKIKRCADCVVVKVYAKKPQQSFVEKSLLRLPTQLFDLDCGDICQKIRVLFTREGLLMVRIALPAEFATEKRFFDKLFYKQQREGEEKWFTFVRKMILAKRWVEQQSCSLFDELERQQVFTNKDKYDEDFLPLLSRDVTLVKQMLKRRSHVWGNEWINFVRFFGNTSPQMWEQQQQRPRVFYKIKSDARGFCVIKLFTNDDTRCEQKMIQTILRLPGFFTESDVRQHLRVQFTREGLVLLRLPILLMEKRQEMFARGTNYCNFQDKISKSLVERYIEREERRSIFEEFQQTTFNTIEQLEEMLERQRGILYATKEWTQLIRLPTRMAGKVQVEHTSFKVKRNKLSGEAYIKITTVYNKVEEPAKYRTTIVRLPRKQQMQLEVNAARVTFFPREGVLVLRVPMNPQQQLAKFFQFQQPLDLYTYGFNKFFNTSAMVEEWKNELLSEELRQLRRSVFETVLPCWSPFQVVPTFYKLFKPSAYKHQLHLQVTLPATLEPQEIVVKANRQQQVTFEINSQRPSLLQHFTRAMLARRSFWLPRDICLEKMEVRLMGKHLHFFFPITERNSTTNNTITVFQQQPVEPQQQKEIYYETSTNKIVGNNFINQVIPVRMMQDF